jgi:hypothetical protein
VISAQALAENGSPGKDVREQRIGRVVDGYDRVIEWLAGPVASSIQTSTIVSDVRWEQGHVEIATRRADGLTGGAMEARAAIVAVPLGVLKAAPDEPGAIAFVPELRQKQAVLDHLAVGHVVRVTLRLTEPVWSSGRFAKRTGIGALDALSFLHTADEDFPVWWTAQPIDGTLFFAGEATEPEGRTGTVDQRDRHWPSCRTAGAACAQNLNTTAPLARLKSSLVFPRGIPRTSRSWNA